MSVLYFLLLVGMLVVIHELGHFAAAKLLDVKVLRFSIGYGRPLVRGTLGETEYQISIFPIGGYVRILGVEQPEAGQTARSFASRPLWQRLIIVLAGPLANLILPVIIYFALFAGHTTLPAAHIGEVVDGGAAARAGLEPGDRVLEIDGRSIRYWEELEDAIRASPGKELHLRIVRNGKVFERFLTPLEETIRSREGGATVQGRVGIAHAPLLPLVGIVDGESPAARVGLRTGDLIIAVHGQPVTRWSDVLRILGKTPRRTSIAYFRGSEIPGVPQVRLLAPGLADLIPKTTGDSVRSRSYTGLEHAEMFVTAVDAGSPADQAELHVGDMITLLDDKPVSHWADLEQRLLAEPAKTFKLTWNRPGRDGGPTITLSHELTQFPRDQRDAYGRTVTRLLFGAHNDVDRGRGATVAIEGRFAYALSKALDRTGETIVTMARGFVQLLTGKTPGDALGGPLMMYRVASESGNAGWSSFFLMMALISVNLALLNLLPIPMLDGGHLVVFAIEGVRRRPLSSAAHERVQLVGLVIIVLITVIAVGNDIWRLVS